MERRSLQGRTQYVLELNRRVSLPVPKSTPGLVEAVAALLLAALDEEPGSESVEMGGVDEQ